MCGDAQVVTLPGQSFDVVVSRLGVMFFEDMQAAFNNLYRMIRPGGQLGFICWQTFELSPWIGPYRMLARHTGEMDHESKVQPYRLSDEDLIFDLLETCGYGDFCITSRDVPILLGAGGSVEKAFEHVISVRMFSQMFGMLTARQQDSAKTDLFGFLQDHETAAGVELPARVWLVTARK